MADRQRRGGRRAWVPSDREVDAGARYRFEPMAAEPEAPKLTLRGRARSTVQTLSPAAIAAGAPVFPLVAMGLLSGLWLWQQGSFLSLLPFIRADMGFDFTFMTTLTSLVGVVTTLLAPAMGYLADRRKRVNFVRVGSIIGVVSAVGTGLAPGAGALIGSRLIGAVGPGIYTPAANPLLADTYHPRKHLRVFTFVQLATTLFYGLAVVVMYVTVFRIGVTWRALFVGTGVLTAAMTFLTFRLREPRRGGPVQDDADVDGDREPKPVSWTEAWRTLSSIKSLRRIWYATPFLTVSQYGLQSLLFFVVTRRVLAGEMSGPGAGILSGTRAVVLQLSVGPLLGVLGLALAAPVAERMMRENPGRILFYVGAVLGLQAFSMLALMVIPFLPIAIFFTWVVGAVATLVLPAQTTLLTAIVPSRVLGMGLQSIAPWQLLGFVVLPVAGVMADRSGVLPAALLLVAILGIGAFVVAAAGANVAHDMRAAAAATRANEIATSSRREGAGRALVIRDLEVSYNANPVLFGVDLDVRQGELLALLGTNGAGKSTLLRAIAGLQEASNGAVFFDGEDITHKPSHLNARDGIVFLPGGRAVFPTLTVEENLRASGWLDRDAGAADLDGRVEEVLGHFPVLRERLGEMAGNLSGGEQQMLALGQCFVMRPRLLMIDELSLGLAPSVVQKLLEIVKAINARGTTVILVEQSLNVAVGIARRAVFMERGRVAFDGETSELMERPDLVRAVFLGTGGARFTPLGFRRQSETRERVLSVTDVGVTFGGVRALDGVSISLAPGEIVGIIGPNGAGKTTLFDAISGFVRPDGGSISVADVVVDDLSPSDRAHAGLCRSFQNVRLFPSLTVRENVMVAMERHLASRSALAAAAWSPKVRASERRAARRVDHVIGALGLDPFAEKFASELSTGTRRLVEVGCLMVADPRVLLLDEPSSGLAQAEVEVLGPVIQRLARELGAGVVMIEHDIPLVAAISDRIVAMELGRVIAEGPPDQVLSDERVVGSYLRASDAVLHRSGRAHVQTGAHV